MVLAIPVWHHDHVEDPEPEMTELDAALGGFEDALRSGRKPSRGQIAAHDLYAFATEAWRLLRGALRRREQEMPG